jgi:hypothetical protein
LVAQWRADKSMSTETEVSSQEPELGMSTTRAGSVANCAAQHWHSCSMMAGDTPREFDRNNLGATIVYVGVFVAACAGGGCG